MTVTVYFAFGETIVGVPLITPVPAPSASPAGNVGAIDHLSGGVPPVASMAVDR